MQVFMIGMPRSGTSILSEAISLHGKLGFISNYNNRFPAMPFLSVISRLADKSVGGMSLRGSKKQKKGGVALLRKYLPHSMEAFPVWEHCCGHDFSYEYLLNTKASAEIAGRTRNYMQDVLRYQGKKRLFAKLTGPGRVAFLRSIFPDCYFINVLRDPRAVVSSLLSVGFWEEAGGFDSPWWKNGLTQADMVDWDESGSGPEALAAVQWRRVVESTADELDVLGDGRFIELRYEDFVMQPEETLESVFQQIGLGSSRESVHYIHTRGKLLNMNHKFREKLTEEQVMTIESLTRLVAESKGYEFS